MKIADFIRAVPDFPKPGILFRDISPLLANPEAFATGIDAIAERTAHLEAGVIAGIESRGFIFGIALAQELGIPFVPVRKPGKLPGETVSVSYELEYGSDSLELHKDAFPSECRVLIIDDLLATGGTARAACQLIEVAGGIVAGVGVLIELEGLEGREALAPYICESVLTY